MNPSPRALLLPYQLRWTRDTARFKLGLMARQVGKDFASAEEGVRDCLLHPKTTWLVGAPSERQSLESLEKWREWAAAYRLAARQFSETRDSPESRLKSARIEFDNGSRVIAVPGRPDTVRGFSANILLTEFAFFEDPEATWRAVLPSISNPLRGGLKKVRLISTPNGRGGKFHELWARNTAEPGPWSCHKVSIHDAVRDGLPVDIEQLRAALDDPDGWAQEFECEFLDTASTLLPYDLLARCEDPAASEIIPGDFWAASAGAPLYVGIDFGRKRDLTVAWTLQDDEGLLVTREVLCLDKLPTDQQLEHLRPRLRRAAAACLDATGPGAGLGDFLVREFGEWRPGAHRHGTLELCAFTPDLKGDLFPKLRIAFDQRRLIIPVSRAIREDLHSVQRVATPSGRVAYRAPRSPDGHADRCAALALAWRASARPPGAAPAWNFDGLPRAQILAARRDRSLPG